MLNQPTESPVKGIALEDWQDLILIVLAYIVSREGFPAHLSEAHERRDALLRIIRQIREDAQKKERWEDEEFAGRLGALTDDQVNLCANSMVLHNSYKGQSEEFP